MRNYYTVVQERLTSARDTARAMWRRQGKPDDKSQIDHWRFFYLDVLITDLLDGATKCADDGALGDYINEMSHHHYAWGAAKFQVNVSMQTQGKLKA